MESPKEAEKTCSVWYRGKTRSRARSYFRLVRRKILMRLDID